MPTYALKCGCGKQFEEFAHAADRWKIKCPSCGSDNVPTDYQETFPPREVADPYQGGVESLAFGVHPSQVEAARRTFPNRTIRSDGSFIIHNRTEARELAKEWHQKIPQ